MSNICEKEIEGDVFGFEFCKCATGCVSNAVEDNTTGRCNCVTGFVAPGCVEECSGACALPQNDGGTEIMCLDTNRCT